MPETATELGERIGLVAASIPNPDTEIAMRSHLVWQARQILSHITPQDLTTTELAGLLGILVIPHSRWLDGRVVDPGGVNGRANLRLIDGWTT